MLERAYIPMKARYKMPNIPRYVRNVHRLLQGNKISQRWNSKHHNFQNLILHTYISSPTTFTPYLISEELVMIPHILLVLRL
jgi:hypothetical protein